SIDQVDTVHLGSGAAITANALKTITNAVNVTISGSANALTSIQATGAVDVKDLSNGHNALTSIAGKTVDLGSGDFTALTSLTGTIKTTGGGVAKLSYDKLATQLKDTGLVIDGSAAHKLEISDATAAGVSTDLSKVTSVGGTSALITITNVNENITLSAKDQDITETVKLSNINLAITNVGHGDVIDVSGVAKQYGIQLANGAFAEANAANDNNILATVDNINYKGQDLSNELAAAEALKEAGISGAATKYAAIALQNLLDSKTYIYYYMDKDGDTTINVEEIKVIAVTDILPTGLTGNDANSTITFAL
ncbi:hypothetical protein, partial [Campylobacter sp.]|uniref:hypothetical protein n=1 Tax=Campylobacter sp. TaxID=205 RepID=UPI002AA66E1B